MTVGSSCNPDYYVTVFQLQKIEINELKNVKGKVRRFFSLTGAGFSYSSYQHPRRDLGMNTNRFSMVYSIPLAGALVFTICN